MNEKINLSPLMRQYNEIKSKHPDTILMFQVGDFYELFYEDAKIVSSFLGIVLTQRGNNNGVAIPLCGVPVHVANTYLHRLVKGGFKVAICEQLEEPKPGKIVDRGVTQVLTPGTLTDENLLNEKNASYLSVLFATSDKIILLFAEILTGQLFITTLDSASNGSLEAELSRFMPDEIVIPDIKICNSYIIALQKMGYAVSIEKFNGIFENIETVKSWFLEQFSADNTNISDELVNAIAILYNYLSRNNKIAISNLKQLNFYSPEDFLILDANTIKNLELVKNIHDGSSNNSLFSVLDNAITPMGSRTLKKWILRPLVNIESIKERFELVNYFFQNLIVKDNLRKLLTGIGDLERIVGRISLGRAHLQDYNNLLKALQILPEITNLLEGQQSVRGPQPHPTKPLAKSGYSGLQAGDWGKKIPDLTQLCQILEFSINEDSSREWLIKEGFNPELDRFRMLMENGTQSILQLEKVEQENTGISSLKIRYNGAHGYGIEITKPNLHLVPDYYIRMQTLVNRERFTCNKLKDLEYDLLRAKAESNELEQEIFKYVKSKVVHFIPNLKKVTELLSFLDAIVSLAHTANINQYVYPEFSNKKELIICQGRHPVIESRLRDKFIANDTNLTEDESLWILTGPNMGGKSTYLRQVALISIMAQIGSFVPAVSVKLQILDRIFTRIGANDNVAEGKSTFLVEMEETSLICSQATSNSLVILDEVGRGTSTFDGLAIAQAVIEYIYSKVNCFCLFATHYHELTNLSKNYTAIGTYYAASTKTSNGIILLHKIMKGIADGSFGLEVAALAKLPTPLIERAREILYILTNSPKESFCSDNETLSKYNDISQRKKELELYIEQKEKISSKFDQVIAELSCIDLDQITPKQALDILCKMKAQLKSVPRLF